MATPLHPPSDFIAKCRTEQQAVEAQFLRERKKMLWETNKITFRWPYIDQPHFGKTRRPETAPAVSRPLKYSQNQGQTVSPTPVMCRCYDAPRLKKYHDRPPMFESPDNEHPSELRVLFGDTLSGGDSVMSGM
eukprot:g11349.t1